MARTPIEQGRSYKHKSFFYPFENMHALSPTFKQVLVHNPAQGVSPLVPASDFPTAFPSLVLVDLFPSGFWLQAHVLWPQKPLYSAHDM